MHGLKKYRIQILGAYISNLTTLSHSYVFISDFKHLFLRVMISAFQCKACYHYTVRRKGQDGVLGRKDPIVTHHDLWLRPISREKWGWLRIGGSQPSQAGSFAGKTGFGECPDKQCLVETFLKQVESPQMKPNESSGGFRALWNSEGQWSLITNSVGSVTHLGHSQIQIQAPPGSKRYLHACVHVPTHTHTWRSLPHASLGGGPWSALQKEKIKIYLIRDTFYFLLLPTIIVYQERWPWLML